MNIFDEIEQIIENRDEEEQPPSPDEESKNQPKDKEDKPFELSDIPNDLNSASILLEVIEQMKSLRENIIPLNERDEDLKNTIRQLKRGENMDRIYSCSHTLETLIQQLRDSLENEDFLRCKLDNARKSIFHLKQ